MSCFLSDSTRSNMFIKPLLTLLIWNNIQIITGQNCRTPGEWCGDTTECCGGCCMQSMCISTYADCSELDDPCLDNYCPGDSVCRLFQPHCKGCEFQMQCVYMNSPDTTPAPSPVTVFNSAAKTHSLTYFILLLIVLIY